MKKNEVIAIIVFVAVSEAAGIVGSLFTAPAIPEWYASLAKPALTPPSWLFAPVWTTLFLLMGIAAYLVWRQGSRNPNVRLALAVFGVQLALNVAWSALFFGMRDPGLALAEIAVLWIAIAATIAAFAKVSRAAAWLLLPYILWVSFAAYLNYAIWNLNQLA